MSTQEPTVPAGSKDEPAADPNQSGNGVVPAQASSGGKGGSQPAVATAKPVSAPVPPPAAARADESQLHAGERPASQSDSTWNKDPVIELVDVHKAFGSLRVLDGVTCRIPRGEITVLMGPSGTGKSVCLRHIVGLLPPDKGDVYVDGKDVPNLKERELLKLRRGIGMLFQDGALFSSMNLYDNVAFPLRQHTRKNEGGIREIVMEHLAEVGLAGAEKRMPNELSGGMRKRAGFARALVMEPRILLFDEPDSGLDPVRTTLLCDLIREISQKYEATSIVVSHDVGAVRRFADNIGILYKGKMRHFGTKHEIEVSDDEFVHQFFNASSEGPLGMD
jgi:phospholipid/cholesterol/gamma-HCH transport system ATP-binding protein